MDELAIISECYADTNLIETLLPPKRGYNHQKGCNNVIKLMKEKFDDAFAVGIIDKDKRQVSYLGEFEEIIRTQSLFLFKHRIRDHYIIQISPALEVFVLNCAKEIDIKVEDFKVSSDLKLFINKTKNLTSKKDPILKGLFKEIKNAEDCIILKKWITYLMTNTLKSSIKDLINLTK